MLDKLFGSKTRVKLLKLFLLHSEEKFYIREIARHLNLQLNSVHRELSNLEDLGLIISSASEEEAKEKKKSKIKTKEKKYYKIDTGFVFYEEIKALIVKSQIFHEKDFSEKLKKAGKIKILILTGLFLNKFDSEVDMLLVGKFDKNKLAKAIKDLEKDLVKEVNYSAMTEDEFNYRREIADIFLYNILDNNKIVVIDEKKVL
ncbi:MAG: winged helix-turn-helix domain-containing protein [bacterium]